MKLRLTVAALTGLSALAACGQQSSNASVTPEDIHRLETHHPDTMTGAENEALPITNGAGAPNPQTGAPGPGVGNSAEPPQRTNAPPAPHRDRPAPAPKPSPAPANPHAGHDMGNMSGMSGMNMSH